MTEPISDPVSDTSSSRTGLFATQPPERGGGVSTMALVCSGVAVLLVLIGFLVATRHQAKPAPNVIQAVDPYASNLVFTDLKMSESSSLSAVKVTYIDGNLRNTGSKTISDVHVQVLFGNDEQLPPQMKALPVTLIRTHEPYVDTEPIHADPIRPGQSREFRLIFEDIGTNWNQQLPQIHVIAVE